MGLRRYSDLLYSAPWLMQLGDKLAPASGGSFNCCSKVGLANFPGTPKETRAALGNSLDEPLTVEPAVTT